MLRANQPTSRRTALKGTVAAIVGLAATAPAVAVAITEPDPIYAAIENYRQTVAAFERFLSAMSAAQEATRGPDRKFGKLPAHWEDSEDQHLEADWNAAGAFETTMPTTLAGIAAAMAFARTEYDRGNLFLEGAGWQRLAFSIERAACTLAGLPVPAWEDDDTDADQVS